MKLTTEQAREELLKAVNPKKPIINPANEVERWLQALQMGTDALALQEPKKPKATEYKNPEIPNATTEQILICPKCESFIGYKVDCEDENYQDNYCSCCGQALSWE